MTHRIVRVQCGSKFCILRKDNICKICGKRLEISELESSELLTYESFNNVIPGKGKSKCEKK